MAKFCVFQTPVCRDGRWNPGKESKDGKLFSKKDGYPTTPFPDGWKGENGLYAAGFTKRGLVGASMDAVRIAQDIAQQWNQEARVFTFPSSKKNI